jgi:hypothetical protein
LSIMAAELSLLIALVADQPLEIDYQSIPSITRHIANCKKLRISEQEIEEAILRGRARRATR